MIVTKFVKSGVVIVAVAALAVYVFYKRSQPVTVEVVQLGRQEVTTTLAVTGRLEAVNRTSVALMSGSARVTRVLVDVGDRVLAGQPLVELDSRDLEEAVRVAHADLEAAKADYSRSKAITEGSKQGTVLAELALRDRIALTSERDRLKAQVESLAERRRQLLAALQRVRAGERSETVAAAEAQVSSDLSTSVLRESEYRRAKKLYDQGVYSLSQLEQAQSAMDQAKARLAASTSQAEALKKGREEDIRQAEAAVREVEASLSGARANLQTAELALKNRTSERQLVESTRAQYKANLAGEQASLSQIAAAEARLRLAESRLRQAAVVAPFDGVVTARRIEPGQVASAGAPLIEIAAPGRLRVRVDVDETYLADVFVGQKATVTAAALEGKQITGRVTEISSAADPQRGTVEVRVSLDEQDRRLVSQMTVDVNLIVAEHKNALVVPRQSVFGGLVSPRVKVLVNGTLQDRLIKAVRGDETHSVVLEGLSEGDLVFLNPAEAPKARKVRPKIVEEPKE